jgi:hypothetical protein
MRRSLRLALDTRALCGFLGRLAVRRHTLERRGFRALFCFEARLGESQCFGFGLHAPLGLRFFFQLRGFARAGDGKRLCVSFGPHHCRRFRGVIRLDARSGLLLQRSFRAGALSGRGERFPLGCCTCLGDRIGLTLGAQSQVGLLGCVSLGCGAFSGSDFGALVGLETRSRQLERLALGACAAFSLQRELVLRGFARSSGFHGARIGSCTFSRRLLRLVLGLHARCHLCRSPRIDRAALACRILGALLRLEPRARKLLDLPLGFRPALGLSPRFELERFSTLRFVERLRIGRHSRMRLRLRCRIGCRASLRLLL